MRSGYKILWTPNSIKELQNTVEYLEENFTEKEISKLAQKVESILELISHNPNLFQKSGHNNVRKVVILKFTTLYFRIVEETVEILSFFSNRQNPSKRKIR